MVKVRMNTADVAAEVKCLRRLIGMRCSNVYDLSPRVVDFQFGLGKSAHHIILELYAQGNLLLTDSDYDVLTLLRTHRDDEKGITMMTHHCYPVDKCRSFERTSLEKLQTALSNSMKSDLEDSSQGKVAEGDSDPQATSYTEKELEKINKKHLQKSFQLSASDKSVYDGGKGITLKNALGVSLGYGPALCEHIILDAGLHRNMKLGAGKEATVDDDTLQLLAAAVARFEDWLQEVKAGENVPEGYIVMQKKMPGKKESLADKEKEFEQVYDEFSPLVLHQFKSRDFTKMETFDESMDEFFSKIESQRAEQQQRAQEGSAMQKLSKIRLDQVEVDLALSAHANARRWFETKKKQASKQEKTITAHEKAFKAAEKKTQRQLLQAKTVASISHIRKVHWFEKFNWFISSENYLVISGRDAQQNDLLVKRYMKKGDLYVHGDLHGASSTVIKNHNPDLPVSPLTLNQAGCFTVCHSQAWNSKIITSAWWVHSHQVSKTAPTGEYLTVGSFMIRGRKNYLPPHPLVMGFGILFRLDESSLAAHLNERRVRCEDEDQENEMEEKETFEAPIEIGSDDERPSEGIGSTDEETNFDSEIATDAVNASKAENVRNSNLNQVLSFSSSSAENSMPEVFGGGRQNTVFSAAENKEASGNCKVQNEVYPNTSKGIE